MSIPESHLAVEAIVALVDGELPAGPAARAARHLAGCTQCRLAVQAQREAKDALHRSEEVTVPGDLLSRLQAIPFTAEVPGAPGPGSLDAAPDQLTLHGASGSWSVPLTTQPSRRTDTARWLRRGVAGSAALGLGLVALAATLAAAQPSNAGSAPSIARPTPVQRHTEGVPPIVRTVTVSVPTAGSTP